jgi:hypothetical protein
VTAPGSLVAGRYRLRSQLGGGGMGAVWLARDELLGRDVAVKQVLVPAGIDAELAAANREAAMREGRIAARLSHPHAVSVYDMVLDLGQPWLVMEYLPSRSLAAVLHQDGVLPVQQVAQIGAQVADALAATHAAGVVHRDVKPGNILIGEGPGKHGLVKITDFGISRARGDVSLTQTGVVKGTPAFLAPEVAQGQSPDEASDVFSLGATLYACLEGTPPFGLSDNALQMLHKVAGGEFTPPQRAGALTGPLMRMLAADPADRPTMEQVRDELARLAAGPDEDVTDVLTARTQLPKTLPGMPARPRAAATPAAAAVGPSTPAARSAAAAAAAAPSTPSRTSAPAAAPVGEPAGRPAPAPAGPSVPARTSDRPPDRAPGGVPGPRTGRAPDPAPGRRRRWVAVLAALLVAGVAAALLVVWLNTRGDDPGTSAADADPTPGTSAPADTSAPENSPEPAETPTPEPTPETSAAPTTEPATEPTEGPQPGTAAEVQAFLGDYYALLPGDPTTAYQRTGPTLRSGSSLGDYRAFWSGFQSVQLGPVEVDEGSLVATAPVTFVDNDGRRFPEMHEITLVRDPDGRLLVDSDRPV